MKYTIYISLLSLLLLSACFKKEDPLILPLGDSEITTVSMGKEYSKEVYFDLGTNSYQHRTLADWDIRFQSGDDEFGVFLNNGTDVTAYKLEIHSLGEPKTVDTLFILNTKELVDAPDGRMENSAFGDWRSYVFAQKSGVYVIQLKYNTGYERLKRIQIISVNDSGYYVTFTDLFKNNDPSKPITKGDTILIPKIKSGNYTYYSFKNGGHIVADAEPEKNTWDFVFTRYKHIFYGILPGNQPFPYIVTGVLSNPNHVLVARDSTNRFNEINGNSIGQFVFSDVNNAIGYDWKSHAYGAGTYTVNSGITYIIKDTDGYYYKLRFLDFINSKGENGYPKFEFIRIL